MQLLRHLITCCSLNLRSTETLRTVRVAWSRVLHSTGDCKITRGVLKGPQNSFSLISESILFSENINLWYPGGWCAWGSVFCSLSMKFDRFHKLTSTMSNLLTWRNKSLTGSSMSWEKLTCYSQAVSLIFFPVFLQFRVGVIIIIKCLGRNQRVF